MTEEMRPVYLTLKEEIVTFALPPGARLREEALAKRFGCSRTPMRDVLKKLEEDRLVEIAPKSGTYVSKLDVAGLSDLMHLRAALECEVMGELAECAKEEDLLPFRKLLGEQASFLRLETLEPREFAETFYAFDNAFHEALYQAVNKESLLRLLDSAFPYFERYRYMTNLRDKADVARLYLQHLELLDALESRDPKRLKKACFDHQFSGRSGLRSIQEKHPEYFVS